MKRPFIVQLATLGVVGNFKAPGTLASVLTLPAVVWLSTMQLSCGMHALLLFLLCIISLWIVSRACASFPGDHDPSAIVIDEVIGCLVTFYCIPLHVTSICVGFILFRLLDIYKPCGIAWIERCTGSWGIVLDDVMAGILANILVRVVLVYV